MKFKVSTIRTILAYIGLPLSGRGRPKNHTCTWPINALSLSLKIQTSKLKGDSLENLGVDITSLFKKKHFLIHFKKDFNDMQLLIFKGSSFHD